MVDVSPKSLTHRIAIAAGTVNFSTPKTTELISASALAKGNVITTAQIAGIQAAKRCAELIPLCHSVPLARAVVDVLPVEGQARVDIRAAAITAPAATGVEMEALTAVSVAALTVYDMCKAVDKGIRVSDVRLVYKEGGRSGVYVAPDDKEAKGIVEDFMKRGIIKR